MQREPETRFADNGGTHLAYQVVGDHGPDLLLVDTWVHHVEELWEFPDFASFMRRLASFARVLHYDRRGTGLSDSVSAERLPDLQTHVADALAVLDAAGVERASILAVGDGGVVASLLAASHPDRVASLILFVPAALQLITPDHPIGLTPEFVEEAIRLMTDSMLQVDHLGIDFLAPSRLGDERFKAHLLRFQRAAVRAGTIGGLYRQTFVADLRQDLRGIRAPTLVLHRSGIRILPGELPREVASLIPGARFVELPGADAIPFVGDVDGLVGEVEEFLTGARTGGDAGRALATLLFTDIVGSTATVAGAGDRRWRELLDEHDRLVRDRIDRFGGREVAHTGDGFLAMFDAPGTAVRCAGSIIASTSRIGVHVRAGVHTGEVELRGSNVGGLAVHIAARVAALAGPDQVLVSSTVKDLMAGSDITFDPAGEHELKGVPDTWRLFRVAEPTGSAGA